MHCSISDPQAWKHSPGVEKVVARLVIMARDLCLENWFEACRCRCSRPYPGCGGQHLHGAACLLFRTVNSTETLPAQTTVAACIHEDKGYLLDLIPSLAGIGCKLCHERALIGC